MNKKNNISIIMAILAAALYAISSPFSKILLKELSPTMMAALLYLGAGIGMSIIGFIQKKLGKENKELSLTKKELPYVVGMITLDIAAPIFLMIGLSSTTAANASLLNNFEIVATSLIALFIFKEKISKRLWLAICFVTVSSTILSIDDISSFSFSAGSLLVILACFSWGLEINCTRMLSDKNPLEITVIKGFGSLMIALFLKEFGGSMLYISGALFLGFIAYGLSIFFYVYAQRELGAAKTSTYYAVAPFIGVAISLVLFKEIPSISFIAALIIMIAGTYLASTDAQ